MILYLIVVNLKGPDFDSRYSKLTHNKLASIPHGAHDGTDT